MEKERQDIETDSPWWGEHVHRYKEAILQIDNPKNILDIACGNGFGTNILANAFPEANITGGDISDEAIETCKQNWKSGNLSFTLMDATDLPFKNNSIDSITSFETIEHTIHYESMLKEFKRVLSQDGIVIISTPNININSPTGIVKNPYHTQEFNFKQLSNLLKKYFSSVNVYGQKYSRYKTSKKYLAQLIESFLYTRGIRKIPLNIKNKLMNKLINRPLYPLSDDFSIVTNMDEILSCKTFYAICKL